VVTDVVAAEEPDWVVVCAPAVPAATVSSTMAPTARIIDEAFMNAPEEVSELSVSGDEAYGPAGTPVSGRDDPKDGADSSTPRCALRSE
jgi:hypothetical protein